MNSVIRNTNTVRIEPTQETACAIFSLVDPSQHGGLETYIRRLTRGLQNRGSAVTWNGLQPPNASSLRATWQPRINQLLPLMARKHTRHLARWTAQWQGRSEFSKAIAECSSVHFVGTGWDLAGFALVNDAMRQGKTVTCWPAVHPGSWGDSRLDLDLFRRVDAVFTQSNYESNHLASLGLPSGKIVRCGCAVSSQPTGDGERFRRKFRLEGKKLILFVGRKSKAKGYHALRDAVQKLYTRGSPVVLVSIGKEVCPRIPTLSPHADLDLGVADNETKNDALAACDIFALPSQAESFGIVYVEAWSYGKPVICGTAPASRELVARHSAGVISDGSPDGIAKILSELSGDPEQAEKMGQAGRRAVAQYYTAEKNAEVHLETWARLRLLKQ